jgi:GDP-L-fucose synthase
MNFWRDKRILVTGGAGFLGTHLVKKLISQRGVNPERISIPRSKDMDLRTWENCMKSVRDVDVVIHLAGRVGGIGYNMKYPATVFYDNAIMGIQLMEAARQEGVEKFITVGTICSYPKFTPVPFKEEDLWKGFPEETNAPYGLAKKMQLVQAQAYRQQYGLNAIVLFLTNLYGPGDNFSADSSHVIPALISKIHHAKVLDSDHIVVWGDGTPTRDFLYVEDAADGILLAAEKYDRDEPLNLGSGEEVSVHDLVSLLCRLMNFKGRIVWDKSKPNGQPRRCVSIERARKELGWSPQVSLEEGLRQTVKWFVSSPNATLDTRIAK